MDTENGAEVLTEAVIAKAMRRAEKVACHQWDELCMGFPDTPAWAAKTCTPKGRCKIGFISSGAGRNAREVWLDVNTGEGRLRKASWAVS